MDVNYLAAMSDDAAPALFEGYDRGGLPENMLREVGALLACSAAQRQAEAQERPRPWQSFSLSIARADALYARDLPGFESRLEDGNWWVLVDGKKQPCPAPENFMD